MSQTRELNTLSAADFAPHVDSAFRLAVDGGDDLVLVLTEVTGKRGDTTPDATRQPFSALFRGPQERVFEQQVCLLEHPDLGILHLFLVPIGPDEKGMRYEAIFS